MNADPSEATSPTDLIVLNVSLGSFVLLASLFLLILHEPWFNRTNQTRHTDLSVLFALAALCLLDILLLVLQHVLQ